MKELVEVIAKALVDDPDSVVVTEREDKKATVLEVTGCRFRHGKSHRKTGTYCKSNSFCCKSSSCKGR